MALGLRHLFVNAARFSLIRLKNIFADFWLVALVRYAAQTVNRHDAIGVKKLMNVSPGIFVNQLCEDFYILSLQPDHRAVLSEVNHQDKTGFAAAPRFVAVLHVEMEVGRFVTKAEQLFDELLNCDQFAFTMLAGRDAVFLSFFNELRLVSFDALGAGWHQFGVCELELQ